MLCRYQLSIKAENLYVATRAYAVAVFRISLGLLQHRSDLRASE
jgi:hypothetical protein